MKLKMLVAFVLVGCGGDAFTGFPVSDLVETDAGLDAPSTSATGGKSSLDSGDSGFGGGGAANGSGGESTMASRPPCCVDADCPTSIPFCSPWGTCYQGGDPYNCDYDSFCESFCVHCSGKSAGACEAKRCVCA